MATRPDSSPGVEPVSAPRAKEIDPSILAEIGNMPFKARIVAESALAGMHRSRHHGSSVEFAEHKEYAPGDNIRHLDWRAYARFDRDYVKRFEDETNLRAILLVAEDRHGQVQIGPWRRAAHRKLRWCSAAARRAAGPTSA